MTTTQTIQSATGTWTASTTSSTTTATTTNPEQMTFTMSSTGTGGMMSFSNMQFLVPSPCFGTGTTMTATMTMGGGMMSGATNTTMSMDMWSAANQTGNHLHMDMTMASDMRSATGTYTLTGVTSGCLSDSGTFTMTHQ